MLDSPIIDELHKFFLILHFRKKKSTFYDRGFSTKDVVFEVWQFITQWMYDTKEVI